MTDSPSRSPYTIYDVKRSSTSVAADTDVVDEKDPMFLKERIISEDIKDLKQYVGWYFAGWCIIVSPYAELV